MLTVPILVLLHNVLTLRSLIESTKYDKILLTLAYASGMIAIAVTITALYVTFIT